MLFSQFRDNFRGDIQGDGGCPTCGHGTEYGMSKEAFEDLLREMDAWIAKSFVIAPKMGQ